jgi:hypothetical protein
MKIESVARFLILIAATKAGIEFCDTDVPSLQQMPVEKLTQLSLALANGDENRLFLRSVLGKSISDLSTDQMNRLESISDGFAIKLRRGHNPWD